MTTSHHRRTSSCDLNSANSGEDSSAARSKPIPIRKKHSFREWASAGNSGGMGKTQEQDTVSESGGDNAASNCNGGCGGSTTVGELSGSNAVDGGMNPVEWKKQQKKKKKKKHSFASLFANLSDKDGGEKEEKAAAAAAATKKLSSSPKHYRTVPAVANNANQRRQVMVEHRYFETTLKCEINKEAKVSIEQTVTRLCFIA
jgi:hypothetical protein